MKLNLRILFLISLTATILALAYVFSLAGQQAAESLQQAPETLRGMYVTHMRINHGDDPAWSAYDFDDSDWPIQDMSVLRRTPGISWLRQNFLVWPEYLEGKTPAAIFLEGGASVEVYFNGELVGSNGVPAENPDEEIVGNIDAKMFIPTRLFREGNNVLAVRMSSHLPLQESYEYHLQMRFEPYAGERQNRINDYLPSILLIGAIGAAALYFATGFALSPTNKSALWLSLLLFCVVTQFAAELVRGLFSYPYQWHPVRVSIITLMATLSGVFLNLLIANKFAHPTRVVWSLVAAQVILLFIAIRYYGQDEATYYVLMLGVVASIVQAAFAAFRKKPDALILLVTLLLFSLSFTTDRGQFLDGFYYFAMSAFAISLFVWRAFTFEQTKNTAIEASARSDRLQFELLKKQIQPHFIMNTLMALSEWIVESPQTGIKMIHALATEFRILHSISDKEKIPLKQELALCDAHLKVMSFRRDQQFQLDAKADDIEALIPPAVFHTLIENAITHNRYVSTPVVFQLKQKRVGATFEYEVRTPIGEPRTDKPTKTSKPSGFGLQYIETRINQMWPNHAHFESSANKEQSTWISRLIVPAGDMT